MTKFKNVFWMGFTVVMTPIAVILLMLILTIISPSKKNVDEVKTYYDTVKVKQKVIVYDTVKIEKIKYINKVKSEKDSTNNLENNN
jgi:preprotein translocase subunit YajC